MQLAENQVSQSTLLPAYPNVVGGYWFPVDPDVLTNGQRKALDVLLAGGKRGATEWDCPKGFAMRSRIPELIKLGFKIDRIWEKNTEGRGQHRRYFLKRYDS